MARKLARTLSPDGTLAARLVLASHNPGKLREIADLLAPHAVELVSAADLGLPEPEETAPDFAGNARLKALAAARASGLPALADDSGICVNALNGGPGVYSARYAGEPKSDARNNQKLVDMLRNQSDRGAHYYCVMVLVRHADDPQPIIADGAWHGQIILEPRGEGGFGYDPYFFLPDLRKTGAELPMEQKNQISHRGKALARLAECIREETL